MSEIRVNNIVSEDGTSAPIYSQGMSIGVGKTLTCAGDFSVGGDVTFSSGATIAGIVTITEVNLNSNLNLVGILTAASANFTGNVSVGGTLTYEDVTNIDSIGIVTARTGIKVLAGGANIVGVTTAASGLNVTAGGADIVGVTTTKGGLTTQKLLKEEVNVVANKLSAAPNIYLENGCVHIFTTAESTTSTPAIKYSSSVNLKDMMSVGESVVVTLITTANASGYSAQITIDGDAVTENWIGGSAPSGGGSSGVDIHTFTIIKVASSGTTDAQLTVIANHSKTS
jgi:hypothetical protein